MALIIQNVNPKSLKEFAEFTKADWAMYFIERWGQIEGDHHRAWVLDQVARILKGCPILIQSSIFIDQYGDKHVKYHPHIDETSDEYKQWVDDMKCDGYDYSVGIAP